MWGTSHGLPMKNVPTPNPGSGLSGMGGTSVQDHLLTGLVVVAVDGVRRFPVDRDYFFHGPSLQHSALPHALPERLPLLMNLQALIFVNLPIISPAIFLPNLVVCQIGATRKRHRLLSS